MGAVKPSPPSTQRPIATWSAGDAVSGFALVRRREERRDKAGKSYLDLELADASGAMEGIGISGSTTLSAVPPGSE